MNEPITPERAREVLAETPASWWDSPYARALETLAAMKTEWGVEVEGETPDTWDQLNLHGLVPHHYADATWLETMEEAESLMADVMEGELYLNARFVHRYVTETISNEDPYR